MSTTAEIGQHLSPMSFLWAHLFASFSAPKVDLTGRTVIVTGGNAGLGYDTVLHFARSSASRIIIASRSITKCQTAARKVYSDVPSYKGKVDVMELDLSSFDNTIGFCKAVNEDEGRLDFIVANAGVSKMAYKQTGDGYEEVLQVNGLSTALMGLLLLPKLEKTAGLAVPEGSKGLKPTLTVVASEVHYWAKFPQQDSTGFLIHALNDPKQFIDGHERYNMSKVLSVWNGRELAKLPAVTSGKVMVNSVNPGLCVSALRDDLGPFLAWVINAISWSAEKGARNFLWSATQGSTPGAFITHCKETPVSLFVASEKGRDTEQRYWTEALEIFKGLKIDSELNKALKA